MPPLALLIPLLSPLITEVVKWIAQHVIADKVITKIPPAVTPLVSTAAGAAITLLAPLAGLDAGVSPIEGAELGLAGVGVHQATRLARTALGSPS